MGAEDSPRVPDDAAPPTAAPIPEWAIQVVQATLREYRYHAQYLPRSGPELIEMSVLRGDKLAGVLSIEHAVHAGPPERHDLRLVFAGVRGDVTERFTPHSLAQLKAYAPVLMGRVCKYGMSLEPKWCADCSYAERHLAGKFEPLRFTGEGAGRSRP